MNNFLRFKNPSTEKAFILDYDEKAIPAMRLGFWLAVILFAVFGILDYFLMPLSYKKMWAIRFFIVIPAAVVAYIFTFIKPLTKFLQFCLSANAVIMGLGIVAMMAIADPAEPGYRFYYAGMMLVIMGICSLFRLRFFYALFSSVIIIASYEFTAIFIQKMTAGSTDSLNYLIFINNNFFFISSNIIGLMAAYYVEYFTRVQFMQQQEIKEKHEDINLLLNKMRNELELARQVQMRLLPEMSPYMPGIKIASLYKPMETLGGDFYDFLRFEEHNLIGFFISDVSGHGLPAALITSMIKALNRTAGNLRLSTSGFLSYINSHLTGQIGENFITAVYAIYDTQSRTLRFSRAGHPFPIHIRAGEITHLHSGGGGIGFNSFMQFEDYTVQLEPGDRIILYTDGLTEQIDEERNLFENTYFEKVLPALSGFTIDDIVSISYRRLIEFHGSDSFEDDICILAFEIL